MNIGKKDIFWNYLATFLRIANAALLFPFVLKIMPTEMVGIWTIFASMYTFVVLMDFGFSPSFTRNVTYVFSGVQSLKSTGHEVIVENNSVVNYSLLKGLISSMQYFYKRIAIIALIMLLSGGTFYIYKILQNYKGDHLQIYISWILLSFITSYNLYTLYYDSLLQGKGLIMKDKQINICGQLINISVSIVLLWLGLQIISLVIGQIISVIVVRILSKKAFFTSEINEELSKADNSSESEILKTIYPNAVKIGLTSLGGILATRSSLFIGSLYLTLAQVASYGITIQLISVIMGLSTIYFATHQPKIVSLRVVNDKKGILEIYKRSMLFLIATYAFGGAGLIFVGPIFLELISSKTQLLPTTLIIVALIGSLLEVNVSMGGTILLTKNYVPFFKASLISGFAIVILLLLAANFSTFSLYTMIIIPIIVNVAYQAWKWPIAALVDLKN